jgi:hypothetical protein
MSQLQFYGVNGKVKQWFESYLNNRYQITQILENEFNLTGSSLWGKITDSVPEGSVLGPLLFLIYINDLPEVVNENTIPVLFTDDTSILVKGSNLKDFHKNTIDAFNCVHKWFQSNLLTINLNKTHCVQFRTKNKSTTDLNIVCNNRRITTMSNVKFLGININDSMNWSGHIEYIIPKLSSA